jgi:TRAP-type C4-dicarboxylate transport system permease small subunit
MRVIDKFEEWVISLMLLLMTGLAFTQVVLRYVFNGGFTWALELTSVFFAIMIFIGISYGVRVGAHIGEVAPFANTQSCGHCRGVVGYGLRGFGVGRFL